MPIRLAYSHNIASNTYGVIFVSTELKGYNGAETWIYKDALNRAEMIRETFAEKNMLNLDQVDMCVDFTKEMTIQKMDEVQSMADKFESKDGKVLAIFVAYVGFSLFEEFQPAFVEFMK